MREIREKITSGKCFMEALLIIKKKIMKVKMHEGTSIEKRFEDF